MLLATGEPPGNIDSNAVAAVPIDVYAVLVDLLVYQLRFSRFIVITKWVAPSQIELPILVPE